MRKKVWWDTRSYLISCESQPLLQLLVLPSQVMYLVEHRFKPNREPLHKLNVVTIIAESHVAQKRRPLEVSIDIEQEALELAGLQKKAVYSVGLSL